PDVHGAGGVGAVAVLQAAEVEDDHVAVGDDAVAGLVLWAGAVGAVGDDGEVHAGVPVPLQQHGEVGGDVGLPAAGEGHRADLLDHGVGGGPGGGQQCRLGRVLDGPQHRQRLGEGGVGR